MKEASRQVRGAAFVFARATENAENTERD